MNNEAQDIWEILSKGQIHGSETPQGLWNNAVLYFKWCVQNPIKNKKTYSQGKSAGLEYVETYIQPFTVKGLCLFCGIDEKYIQDIKNSKRTDSEYYIVVTRILYIIANQNLTHAMVNIFSPILVSKILGIDTEDVPMTAPKVEFVTGLPELNNSETEILEKSNLEWEELQKIRNENS